MVGALALQFEGGEKCVRHPADQKIKNKMEKMN
jgi:hypothetical protein